MERIKRLLLITFAIIVIAACNAQQTPSAAASVPTTIIEPVFTQQSGNLPLTESDVPRVTVEEARAALDSGSAVFVDVRSPEAYETSHVPGAISIPLDGIETNPAGLTLDKEQWIITYCT